MLFVPIGFEKATVPILSGKSADPMINSTNVTNLIVLNFFGPWYMLQVVDASLHWVRWLFLLGTWQSALQPQPTVGALFA